MGRLDGSAWRRACHEVNSYFLHMDMREANYDLRLPYARVNFRGDPDLVPPEGEQWGDVGKIKCHFGYYF